MKALYIIPVIIVIWLSYQAGHNVGTCDMAGAYYRGMAEGHENATAHYEDEEGNGFTLDWDEAEMMMVISEDEYKRLEARVGALEDKVSLLLKGRTDLGLWEHGVLYPGED